MRIVPLYPPIAQLEQLDPALQAVALAEVASISPDLLGDLGLLPGGPLPSGLGASRIITSFTFSNPNRFNDSSFAAFYGSESLKTAIAETVHHAEASLRDVKAPAQTLPSRIVLHVDVDASTMIDVRAARYPEIYDPNDYTESRVFGALARAGRAQGIAFDSVRRKGGQCVAVYDRSALSSCREDRELVYRYDGTTIAVSEVHYP